MRPWARAFWEERSLPAAVRGPVESSAFARLARARGSGVGGWGLGIGVGVGFVIGPQVSSSMGGWRFRAGSGMLLTGMGRLMRMWRELGMLTRRHGRRCYPVDRQSRAFPFLIRRNFPEPDLWPASFRELSSATWKLAGHGWGNRAAFSERLHVVQRARELRSPCLNVLLPSGVIGQHRVVEDQRVN